MITTAGEKMEIVVAGIALEAGRHFFTLVVVRGRGIGGVERKSHNVRIWESHPCTERKGGPPAKGREGLGENPHFSQRTREMGHPHFATATTSQECTRVELACSELQCRQRFRGIEVCRDANFSPAFCIRCARRLGLRGVLDRVTAQQEMCRETIAVSQTKNNL